jgi:hypothetical protein
MTFNSEMLLLVRSNPSEGNTMPRQTRAPVITPKYPMGTPPIAEMAAKAELSQLKKAPMSQNDPAQIVAG